MNGSMKAINLPATICGTWLEFASGAALSESQRLVPAIALARSMAEDSALLARQLFQRIVQLRYSWLAAHLLFGQNWLCHS